MSQSEYMLMFSLGPVQVFIAQARKTRDLWIGSLQLSKLMEVAMTDIDGHFVFPARKTVDQIPDIPNKYVALFSTLESAEAAAQQSQKQIAACWSYISESVYAAVVKHGDEKTREIWERQTAFASVFEIYWVIRQRKPEQSYPEWLKDANELFAARKRLRDFHAQNEPGIKSSISGQREILQRRASDPKSIADFWQELVQDISSRENPSVDISPDGNERLDAIDLIKRFAMFVPKNSSIPALSSKKVFSQPFPSTSSIATASFVESLLTKDIETSILQAWRHATSGRLTSKRAEAAQDIPFLQRISSAKVEREWLLRRDGDLYFSEVFSPRRLKKDYQIDDLTAADTGRGALRTLLAATAQASLQAPTPYYAVIQMDGDRMGILLNGVKDQEEHESLSRSLSEFARETAGDLIETNYPGRLVYAGGDDVLAFVPLSRDIDGATQPHHVLELADQLQNRYHQKISSALCEPKDESRVTGITASMGIVIAHHYTSLSYVLRSARQAESSAKHQYGRNALVVTIIRRSGEQTRVGCRWRYAGLRPEGQPIVLFSTFWNWFKLDLLSPKCVHLLMAESAALVGLDQDAQRSEIARVLARQFSQEKTSDVKAMLGLVADDLVKLAGAMDAVLPAGEDDKRSWSLELHADQRHYGLVEVLGWLLVVAFLTRKEQE